MRIKYPIKRIDLKITDNGKYADMAYFFDKPEISKAIFELRKKWIKGKTIRHEEIDNFINSQDTNDHWRNYFECRLLAKKYGVGSTFVRPIVAAVLSGEVYELDYSTAMKEPIVYGTPDSLQLDDKVTYTSKRIRKVDLIRLRSHKDDKSISTVRRNRDWYWLYQRSGYRKIAKKTHELLETVRSGIRAYKEGLDTHYSVV